MRTPASKVTAASVDVPGPTRSVMASSRVRWPNGTRLADPPPIDRSIVALGPMTATEVSVAASKGKTGVPSIDPFRNRTVPLTAARRVSARAAGASTDPSGS